MRLLGGGRAVCNCTTRCDVVEFRHGKSNSQNGAKLLTLPVGNSDWAHVVAHNWHADKTQLMSGSAWRWPEHTKSR